MMAINETKMKIVIDNYFKTECDVNTSIRQAFEKGFRIGVLKGQSAKQKTGKWILHKDGSATCSECHFHQSYIWDLDDWQNYCGICGAMISKFGWNSNESLKNYIERKVDTEVNNQVSKIIKDNFVFKIKEKESE